VTTPVLQALLLADHVYQDRGTGKHVVAGIFSGMGFIPKGARPKQPPGDGSAVPARSLIRAGSPFAYLSLTEVHGLKTIELRYVDLSTNDVLLSTTFQVKCNDPLETVEVALPLPSLPAPHAGVFALELLCEGTWLGSHRVKVVQDPNFTTDEPEEPAEE
jgi:hypothetical protein